MNRNTWQHNNASGADQTTLDGVFGNVSTGTRDPNADALQTLLPMLQQVESMQSEIDSLKAEIALLRRRDDHIDYQMRHMDEEMRLAARLQQDFLPKNIPQIGRVRFHTLFRPASYVSGDIYDIMRLDENNVGFYMADAVGHGTPAALLTMFIKQALVTKEIGPTGYRLLHPDESIRRLNHALLGQDLSYATFATAVYGRINVQTLDYELARGGHPNPVVLHADGTLDSLNADGSLLGIFENEEFPTITGTLRPGDRLIIVSDGIEVALGDGPALDTNQWHEQLSRRTSLDTPEFLRDLVQNLESEAGSLRPKDDLTIVVVEAAA